MRIRMGLVLVAGALALAACHDATVRGPQGQSLTATTPRSMTLRRGENAPLQVGIDQDNFSGPVTVSISRLPRGVESDVNSQKVETTSATFSLRASKTADLVTDQAVLVTVEGLNGRTASQYVDLSVKD